MKKLLLMATLVLSAALPGFEGNTQEAEEDLAIQSTDANKTEDIGAPEEMEREESEEKNLSQDKDAPPATKPVPEFKGRPLAF